MVFPTAAIEDAYVELLSHLGRSVGTFMPLRVNCQVICCGAKKNGGHAGAAGPRHALESISPGR
jgi:hypothetical protein